MQSLPEKLRFRGPAVILNSPATLLEALSPLQYVTSFDNGRHSDNTLVFVKSAVELAEFFQLLFPNVVPDSVLWIAYPKGSGKAQVDINRDSIRVTAETYGVTTVTAIAIDDTWSALRFRPVENVGT